MLYVLCRVDDAICFWYSTALLRSLIEFGELPFLPHSLTPSFCFVKDYRS